MNNETKEKKTVIRQITPKELDHLGYRIGTGEIPIGYKRHISCLYELMETDSGVTAKISFLKVLREPGRASRAF